MTIETLKQLIEIEFERTGTISQFKHEVFPFNIPFRIPGKTDIEVRVLTPAAAGTTSTSHTKPSTTG